MQHTPTQPVTFVLDDDVASGVRKVAEKVAADFGKITGADAVIALASNQANDDNNINAPKLRIGTLGVSQLIDNLAAQGQFDDAAIKGKREVYQIAKLDDNTWAVIGSDRLGTIYGLYAISEYAGVSPLHYWGDVAPIKRDKIVFDDDLATISREPSVKYRGLFINDEWPCFGTWAFTHFGGFTAEMYDHVFDLLLRLKGNYIWPAMWTSSFALDGPGDLNEVLADEYGITVGASHHEPLLRASEEWDKVKGSDTPYGTEWNYLTNKQGLLNYWRDAMKRSGHLNKLIMMGIRGERDSELLGEDATLKANIDLLKDAITEQRKIIAETDTSGKRNPQMLALYKEVEEYYYGSKDTPGLREWKELTHPADGGPPITLMFCEDNFGFMRSLPENDAERASAGMYYHFDYHGGPISYEWMPSTSFERTHDQMSMAYDYGIKDVWVVNVGDLKFNEVQLAFFLAMAYDMDTYGSHNPNAISEYTSKWVAKTFTAAQPETQQQIAGILHQFLRLNAARRPEALNEHIYHPAHNLEADRVLAKADHIQDLDQQIEKQLDPQTLIAYRSLIGIPARASANLVQMQVNAAKNAHFAAQGKHIANAYADAVTKAIAQDYAISDEIAAFQNGKWKGHEQEAHVGFRTWNEDGSKYPLRQVVEPIEIPHLIVSRADDAAIAHKSYGGPMTIIVDDFKYAGETQVLLEIANAGKGDLKFTITGQQTAPWLKVSETSGTVTAQQPIVLTCDRSQLTEQPETVTLTINGGGEEHAVEGYRPTEVVNVQVTACKAPGEDGSLPGSGTELPPHTYLAGPGNIVAINANHFAQATPGANGEAWEAVPLGGRDGDAIRVFPTTAGFAPSAGQPNPAAPQVTYRALITEPGEYTVEVWQVPTNAVVRGTPLQFSLAVKAGESTSFYDIVTAVAADVDAGNPHEPRWAEPVLDNIRKTTNQVNLKPGIAEITIGAIQPNLMLERILVYPAAHPPKKSYLGPMESAVAGN